MKYKVLMKDIVLNREWSEIASFESPQDAIDYAMDGKKSGRIAFKVVDEQGSEVNLLSGGRQGEAPDC